MNRRTFLQATPAAAALAAARPASRPAGSSPHVVVVGAGAFGGWTALHLVRRGARVTLLDAWGPGNSRASSGGQTRVTRRAYTNPLYVALTTRALDLWKAHDAASGRPPVFHRAGVLFMAAEAAPFVEPASRAMTEAGAPHEVLTGDEVARRFPAVHAGGIGAATWEPDMGFLLAREGCQAVVDAFVAEGGAYRTAHAAPGPVAGGALDGVRLADGTALHADAYVFATGPWLGQTFPDAVGPRVVPTRQEVFYFGTPPGDPRYDEGRFPVWADFGERVWYGVPGSERRGFKVALDDRGPLFDPTNGDRAPTPALVEEARAYVAHRFPGLAGAPLLAAEVCQYEQSPDGDLLVDRHPGAANVWLVGGGSGHGYKLGPAVGEMAAGLALGERSVEPAFALARFG